MICGRHAAIGRINALAFLWLSTFDKECDRFLRKTVGSNRSTRSRVRKEWIVHERCCGNPKSRVNPVFAGRQLQWPLTVQ